MRHSIVPLALLLGIAGLVTSAGPAAAAFPGSNGRIAFASDRDAPGLNGREIYTTAADGSDPWRLTTNLVADLDPAYSPDGTRIAFTRENDIWVMNADGTGQKAISGPEGPGQPAGMVAGQQPDRLCEQPEHTGRRHHRVRALRA
jgi:WD40-like Beta Propeller Repeat